MLQLHPILLASGSAIRQQMLRAVGLEFSVEPSGVDEEALTPILAHLPVPEQALALGRAKALAVSARQPQAYILAADQMCAQDGKIFGKPGSFEQAEAQLAQLVGRTHQQHCGAVIAHGGQVVWEMAAMATLTMHALSDAEIRAYIQADAPLASCGSYKFESIGRHLFAATEGDHDVIKGLPLVPMLAQLRALGVVRFA
jgi:septum formation protein